MTKFEYPVVLEADDNETILATVPDVRGVHSFGEDEADAIDHAREALIVMFSAMMDDNEVIPAPSKVSRGGSVVSLPTLVASKLMIYNAMKEQGVTRSELARRLGGKNPTHITRLLNVLHQSRHDQIDEALAVLDQRITVDTKPKLSFVTSSKLGRAAPRAAMVQRPQPRYARSSMAATSAAASRTARKGSQADKAASAAVRRSGKGAKS